MIQNLRRKVVSVASQSQKALFKAKDRAKGKDPTRPKVEIKEERNLIQIITLDLQSPRFT
jgi:hypothetical protein